jgi:hypothetical protein
LEEDGTTQTAATPQLPERAELIDEDVGADLPDHPQHLTTMAGKQNTTNRRAPLASTDDTLRYGMKPAAIQAKPTTKTIPTIYRGSLPPIPSSRRPAAPPESRKERGGGGAGRSTLNERLRERASKKDKVDSEHQIKQMFLLDIDLPHILIGFC